MPFKIVRNDLTKMETDAIVNTASAAPVVGPGCDSAVYQAAGWETLLKKRQEIGYREEGEAFLTEGYALPAKYIIHAVSPLYQDGTSGEEGKLRACYRNSLQLAVQNGLKSIAFPLISTGSFGYPREEGLEIALEEIRDFPEISELMVYLVVFDEESTSLGKRICSDLESYIDRKYVEQKEQEEYRAPEDRAFFGAMPMVQQPIFRNAVSKSVKSKEAGPREASKDRNGEEDSLLGHFRRRRNDRRTACSRKPAEPGAALKERREDAAKGDMALPAPMPQSVEQRVDMMPEMPLLEDAVEEMYEQRQNALHERMRHLADTYQQYLLYLIEKKGMTNAEVYKRALVDKKVFAKIKANPEYHPKKITALCLCVGAKLNLDETRDLLARAGYALSPCDKTDVIFSFFIENRIYDMIEIDIQLEEHGLPCIVC